MLRDERAVLAPSAAGPVDNLQTAPLPTLLASIVTIKGTNGISEMIRRRLRFFYFNIVTASQVKS